jgi:glutaredoxin
LGIPVSAGGGGGINPKQIRKAEKGTNPKPAGPRITLSLWPSDFGFVSGFGFPFPPHSPFDKPPNLHQYIVVKPKRIRLFIKPYCEWCHKAIRWLDEQGLEYEKVDVIADEAAYDEMIRLSGRDLAPVLDVDGKILADFGPEQLADFWANLEK